MIKTPRKYSTAKEVYKHIRDRFRDWFRERGYKRVPGSEASWYRDFDGIEICIGFFCNSRGSSTTGSDLHGMLSHEPEAKAMPVKSEFLSYWLDDEDLETLRWIQKKIITRFPKPSRQDKAYFEELNKLTGLDVMAKYEGRERYVKNTYIPMHYYDLADVDDWLSFTEQRLDKILENYLDFVKRK